MTPPRIPVTVLTGFLGSGKTTLLNRVLREHHGQRVAVIENELGEIGVDQALVIDAEEEIFELSNGCICCRVRGDLIRILGSLLKRRDRLDRILIETTGLANPGPVAQTFFIDEEIKSDLVLDGIVTLVDAGHIDLHLETSSECQEQIAFADVIVLNKVDLVSASKLRALEDRICRMNPVARIHRAERANVDLRAVLDVGGFDLGRALASKPAFLEPEYPFEWTGLFELDAGEVVLRVEGGKDPSADVVLVGVDQSEAGVFGAVAEQSLRVTADPTLRAEGHLLPGHVVRISLAEGERTDTPVEIAERGAYAFSTEHLPEEFGFQVRYPLGSAIRPTAQRTWKPSHVHEESVRSIGIRTDRPVDRAAFEAWFGDLLRDRGQQIYRAKGVLRTLGSDAPLVFQSVHMLLESAEDRRIKRTEDADSLVVLIGKGLDEQELRGGFARCLR